MFEDRDGFENYVFVSDTCSFTIEDYFVNILYIPLRHFASRVFKFSVRKAPSRNDLTE